MRFLFLTQYFPPEVGGPQTRLQSMAEELLRRGHEVEVVTARPNYPRGKFFDQRGARLYVQEIRNGVSVHRVWIYPAMGGGIGRMLNYGTFTVTCLLGLLRCRKPDYLFVESPPLTTSIPAWIAKLFWHVPIIFNVADLWPEAIVDNGFLQEGIVLRLFLALEKWSYRRATYVNAVTDGIRSALIAKKGLQRDQVLFLPNGVDTVRYQPGPPDETLQANLGLAGKRIILWAGTLGYAHGLEFVLQAAKRLLPRRDIHFLFLGDGSSRKQLEQMKEDLGLSNVTFHDPVPIEQLPPYYSIAECGLASLRSLPVHEGARPSKIFPVLASGKPLLYVGTGECAQLIATAGAGLVVPPENPEALALAIVQLFENPERIKQLGENARRFIQENFDWSQLVGSWISQLAVPKPESRLNPETSTI